MRIMRFSVVLLFCGSFVSNAADASAPTASNRNVIVVTGQSLARNASAGRERSHGIGWTDYLRTRTGSVEVVKRTAVGRAEVHRKWTDVWHVIAGTATLVTGGTLANASESEPGELRANAVSGGQTTRIGAGDLIVIPAGVPHWVKAVQSKELVYLVVKIPPDAAL
jgi:mannose-6-phosphate isomerase-like protein (cupin superfamily)